MRASARELLVPSLQLWIGAVTGFEPATSCSESEDSTNSVIDPYRIAVFVRISDKYAANILRTALFTVIVRYIFTSCREYPANKVGLTKK